MTTTTTPTTTKPAMKHIIAVTGLARSGTSLMMRMLHAAGIPVHAENLLSFEHSDALGLPKHPEFLLGLDGHAVKILDPHRYTTPMKIDVPPPGTSEFISWSFILMERNPLEQAKSQIKLLRKLNPGTQIIRNDPRTVALMNAAIQEEMEAVESLLECTPFSDFYKVQFEELLEEPLAVARDVLHFLKRPAEQAGAMAAQVVKRPTYCIAGMLEQYLEEAGAPR